MRKLRLMVAVLVAWAAGAASAQAAGFDVAITSGATVGGSFSGGSPNTFTPTADNAIVNVGDLTTALASAPVVITAGGAPGTQDGNISVSAVVEWSSTNSLTLSANGNVFVNQRLTAQSPSAALSLTAAADVFQGSNGPIQVPGATTASTPSGIIDVNDAAANDFGTFGVPSAPLGVQVSDTNALGLAGVSTTGELVVSAGGALTATGDVNVTGATSLAAPTSITLTQSGNDFGGPVSSATNGDLNLWDANALILGTTSSGDASIASEGALTQTGAISDTGSFEVQGDGGVTLTNASNDFDDLWVSSDGGSATVRDANSVNLPAVEVTSPGAATVIAGNDLIVPDVNTFYTAGAMTLVSDANAGSAVGPGGIDILGDRAITSTAAPVRLYTAQRSQNSISALATLNGATFTPGTEFVDSATEVWNTAFPAGTATSPFTIFYKQAAPPPPPPVDPPETTLTKTPKKKVKTKKGKKKAKVAFEFTSSVAGSTFECALDGKASACSSPFKKKVKKGKHEFSVTASAAGKTDPTPASFAFKVKLRK